MNVGAMVLQRFASHVEVPAHINIQRSRPQRGDFGAVLSLKYRTQRAALSYKTDQSPLRIEIGHNRGAQAAGPCSQLSLAHADEEVL